MKLNLLIIFFSLLFFLGCKKENLEKEIDLFNYEPRIKKIIGYQPNESPETGIIAAEYEYDSYNRIYKINKPKYENDEITGIKEYDLYKYNSKGHLIKIENYRYLSQLEIIRTTVFTYSEKGEKIREFVEYTAEETTYKYSYLYKNDLLIRKESFKNDEFRAYVTYEYNNKNFLIKETTFDHKDKMYGYTIYHYHVDLNIQSDIYYWYGDEIQKVREEIKTYDEKNRLFTIESSYVVPSSNFNWARKYEYYD
ncbi:MAG: hypothetical protein ABFS16_04070 [Bacteroidota bacterium]